MAIDSQTAEYRKAARRWRVMRAVLDGEDAIKGLTGEFKPEQFIPHFFPHDQARYEALLERASFFEITSWTHSGMVSAVFRKSIPQQEFPENLQYLDRNADGSGLGIEQVARQVVDEVLAVGRIGLLVEYIDSLGQAVIKEYNAESILDVIESSEGGAVKVVKVRLCETVSVRDDNYNEDTVYQYRILGLDEEGFYYQEVYDEDGDIIGDRAYPTDFGGSKFDYIPFFTIGAKNNRAEIDKPPLLGIAWLNVSHFRNSADFEENLHIHGQGTLFVTSEMSNAQFEEANPNGITIGARAGHFIGANGNAILLQLSPSTALTEAMDKKVLMAIGIGARYLQDSAGRQKTAEAAKIDEAQRSSGLSALVGNCEDGINSAIDAICQFMGANEDDVEFRLNRDFYDKTITAQEAQVMLLLKEGNAMALTDIVNRIKMAGWISGDRTIDDIKEEIESEG